MTSFFLLKLDIKCKSAYKFCDWNAYCLFYAENIKAIMVLQGNKFLFASFILVANKTYIVEDEQKMEKMKQDSDIPGLSPSIGSQLDACASLKGEQVCM